MAQGEQPKSPASLRRHSLLDYQMLVVTLGLYQCNLTSDQSDLPYIKTAPTQYPINLHGEDEASVFTAHDSIPSPERLRFGINLAVTHTHTLYSQIQALPSLPSSSFPLLNPSPGTITDNTGIKGSGSRFKNLSKAISFPLVLNCGTHCQGMFWEPEIPTASKEDWISSRGTGLLVAVKHKDLEAAS